VTAAAAEEIAMRNGNRGKRIQLLSCGLLGPVSTTAAAATDCYTPPTLGQMTESGDRIW